MTTYSKNVKLNTTPHYTDERFEIEQTVFGKPSKSPYGHEGLSYVYSDRLWQWDNDKSQRASEIANETDATLRSARWYDAYLSAYFEKPIEVVHIIAGVNRSTGYPYAIFGYKERDSSLSNIGLIQ